MSVMERIIGKERFSRILKWMYTPIDGASMAFFRVGYGAIMFWEMTRYFDHGWIKSYYTGKDFYFKYPGFSWVHPWPSLELMEWHFIVMGILGLMIMVGFMYRFAAIAMVPVFSYIYLLEQARYLNHFYFVILVAITMAFVPASRGYSIDSWIKREWPKYPFLKARSAFIDQWTVWAVKIQFGITYFYGGIAKLNWDWMQGYPMINWIADESEVPFIGPYVHEPWMGLFLSWAGLIMDLAFVPLLLYRPTRWLGLILALMFNLMNHWMFSIGIFPWAMIVGTTLFMEPDWPKQLYDFFAKGRKVWRKNVSDRLALLTKEREVLFKITTLQKALATFMIVFFTYQFIFPFRHWLYPGVVHWTEEGHMYAWHMKLRSKRGKVDFIIKDPDSGREFEVDPDDYLNNRQERKMGARPTMILQFAHWLRDKYIEQGMVNVQVYADSKAALNGRPEQRLIDPNVDLAKVKWSIFPADWIVPLDESLKIQKR